jgi:serine/threonine protein kinase
MAMTRHYCSPETADSEPRNTASDIWSLGVVFLEMAAVLKRRGFQYVCHFLSGTGSRKSFPYANIGGVRTLVGRLKLLGDQANNVALEWTQDMLNTEPHLRPTARDLTLSIVAVGGFCGECCVSAGNVLGG